MPRILVLDNLPREAIERLNTAPHLDYEIHTGPMGPSFTPCSHGSTGRSVGPARERFVLVSN